jgi:hypothetical protein
MTKAPKWSLMKFSSCEYSIKMFFFVRMPFIERQGKPLQLYSGTALQKPWRSGEDNIKLDVK